MKERPILFSAPMVRAILAGTKTQTRRVVKPQPNEHGQMVHLVDGEWGWNDGDLSGAWRCPYGHRGDQLWVRETHLNWWKLTPDGKSREFSHVAAYRADGYELERDEKWIPAIHMLRAASRIQMEVTDVRVERLQAISEDDARAEGALEWGRAALSFDGQHADATDQFRWLWDSINGQGPARWDANPWVWVVSFRRVAMGEQQP